MKNIIKNLWVILVCLSFGLSANAQKREFKLNSRTTDYSVISLGDKGLALSYRSQKEIAGDDDRYLVSKYSQNLEKEFHLRIDVPKAYTHIQSRAVGTTVYMLFAIPTTRFSKYSTITEMVATKHFQVIKVDLEKKEHKIVVGEVPGKLFAINGFEVIDDDIYVVGHSAYNSLGAMFAFAGKKPHALLFSASGRDDEFKLQTTNYKGASMITAIEKASDGQSLNVVITNYISKKEMAIYFIQAKRGRLGREEAFKFSDTKELVDFTFHEIDRKKKVLAGNFGDFKEETEGIFITQFGDREGSFIKYHKFRAFEDFYNFVEETPGKKISDKEKEYSNLSKRKNFQYSTYMHPVHVFNTADTGSSSPRYNYTVVAEAYYPEYKTETIEDELDNGYTITKQANVFYGYKYTHILVANFDDGGDIDWSICLPIFKIATYQIKPRCHVTYNDDEGTVTVTYGTEGFINQVTIKDGEVIKEEKPAEGLNNKELFIVKNNYSMDLQHWYDDYFIASGYKKFDYYGEGEKLIFFMNKVQAGNTLDFQLQEEVTEDE